MNGLCNDKGKKIVEVPLDQLCPSRWFYWSDSETSWKFDETMSVRCFGKDLIVLLKKDAFSFWK